MLHVYDEVYRDVLAIPPVIGKKTEKEKFAGAEATYTLEPMMHNGVALQGGTTHYFGDGFAKAFDITFTGRDNGLHHPYQTSWGMSTRLIGAVIMVHGDDSGLVLPRRSPPSRWPSSRWPSTSPGCWRRPRSCGTAWRTNTG